MIILNFIVHGQPIARQRPRRAANGGMYDKQADVFLYYKKEIRKQIPEGFKIPDKDQPIKIDCVFFREPAKNKMTKKFVAEIENEDCPCLIKPDRDNLEKMILDACSKQIYLDDNQVFAGDPRKYWSINPRTEITITIYEKGDQAK